MADVLGQPISLRVDGRVAWVTGPSRGLGRTIACSLAAAGSAVVLSPSDADALRGG